MNQKKNLGNGMDNKFSRRQTKAKKKIEMCIKKHNDSTKFTQNKAMIFSHECILLHISACSWSVWLTFDIYMEKKLLYIFCVYMSSYPSWGSLLRPKEIKYSKWKTQRSVFTFYYVKCLFIKRVSIFSLKFCFKRTKIRRRRQKNISILWNVLFKR